MPGFSNKPLSVRCQGFVNSGFMTCQVVGARVGVFWRGRQGLENTRACRACTLQFFFS